MTFLKIAAGVVALYLVWRLLRRLFAPMLNQMFPREIRVVTRIWPKRWTVQNLANGGAIIRAQDQNGRECTLMIVPSPAVRVTSFMGESTMVRQISSSCHIAEIPRDFIVETIYLDDGYGDPDHIIYMVDLCLRHKGGGDSSLCVEGLFRS